MCVVPKMLAQMKDNPTKKCAKAYKTKKSASFVAGPQPTLAAERLSVLFHSGSQAKEGHNSFCKPRSQCVVKFIHWRLWTNVISKSGAHKGAHTVSFPKIMSRVATSFAAKSCSFCLHEHQAIL